MKKNWREEKRQAKESNFRLLKKHMEDAIDEGFHEFDRDEYLRTIWFVKRKNGERVWRIIGVRDSVVRIYEETDSHLHNAIIPWL